MKLGPSFVRVKILPYVHTLHLCPNPHQIQLYHIWLQPSIRRLRVAGVDGVVGMVVGEWGGRYWDVFVWSGV